MMDTTIHGARALYSTLRTHMLQYTEMVYMPAVEDELRTTKQPSRSSRISIVSALCRVASPRYQLHRWLD